MASTNQSPEYQKAQSQFLSAKNDEERVEALEEMIRECPKHKSSESMLANLKTRYKKLKEKIETKSKKSGKSSKEGIKKESMQAVIVGYTNSGKSSLISLMTNAKPKISFSDEVKFTTTFPIVGMMDYSKTSIQIVEIPAIESDYYDRGIVNTADTILILVTKIEEIKYIEEKIERVKGKRIIVFNKIDLLEESNKRKISAHLSSKKYNFVLISVKTREGIEELKGKIFKSFGKLRIYTKEPGKEKSEKPIILNPESSVRDVAEKILKGFSEKVVETKIWGPSSKFPGQKVGLNHVLKDMDIVEFKTK